MKLSSLLLATLALPASVAFAQTPPPPGTTDGQIPYIPLFGSGTGGANGAASNSAWFIDTQRNQVVLCTAQAGGGNGGGGGQNFTCTSQPVPNTGTPPAGGGTPPPGGTPPTGGGTPPAGGGTPPTGGAGSNPMGG